MSLFLVELGLSVVLSTGVVDTESLWSKYALPTRDDCNAVFENGSWYRSLSYYDCITEDGVYSKDIDKEFYKHLQVHMQDRGSNFLDTYLLTRSLGYKGKYRGRDGIDCMRSDYSYVIYMNTLYNIFDGYFDDIKSCDYVYLACVGSDGSSPSLNGVSSYIDYEKALKLSESERIALVERLYSNCKKELSISDSKYQIFACMDAVYSVSANLGVGCEGWIAKMVSECNLDEYFDEWDGKSRGISDIVEFYRVDNNGITNYKVLYDSVWYALNNIDNNWLLDGYYEFENLSNGDTGYCYFDEDIATLRFITEEEFKDLR